MKAGWKTSEWQISVGLIVAMVGAAATAMLKYMESNPNPGWLTLALVAIAAAAATGGTYSIGRSMVKAAEAKNVVQVLLVGLGLTGGSTVQAQELPWGLRASVGPSVALVVYTPGGTGEALQVGSGAGMQVSITHPKFEVVLGGQTWDGLSFTAVAYGRLVSPASRADFGEMTAGAGICFMSSAICAVGMHTLISTGPARTGWSWGLSWSVNFAGGGGEVATFGAKPPRANTVTLWR